MHNHSTGACDALWRSIRRAGHAGARRGLSRAARVGAQDLREISRRVLAPARGRAGLSDRLHPGIDRGRVSRLADPGGVWRVGLADPRRRGDPRRDQRLGLHRKPGPCPDVHHGHGVAARQRRAEAALSAQDRIGRIAPAGVRRHRADHRLRHDQAQDPRRARGQFATTSSTGRRSGPRAPGTPT